MNRIRKYKDFIVESESQYSLTKEQEEFLDSGCGGRYWTLNQETGMVEIKVHFYASNKGITDLLGIKFQNTYKDFLIANNSLKTLKGCPKYVGGRFVCSDNELESLEGGPIRVEGSYYCSRNRLKTLNGCAEKIGGEFHCDSNQLENLIGGPNLVSGEYNCSNNLIVSLEGLGTVGSPYFKCSGNPVPEEILKRISSYMQYYHTKSYKTSVKNIWHNLSMEEKAMVYLPEFDWIPEKEKGELEKAKYHFKKFNKIKHLL
jgi:hypothetical protein